MKSLLTIFFIIITSLSFGQNKWKHIHESDRLKVIQDSLSVTGYVEDCYQYLDGDFVINLRLDSCFELLNSVNICKLGGLLEVEIICQHSTIFADCFGYLNDVEIPKVGDHIRVLGTYVLDKRHKYNEIHPVLSLEFLK